MKHASIYFWMILTFCSKTMCLENGLARTPPMGWLAWEKFGCNVNCNKDPSNCISEKLFMDMADRFVSDGYKDVGYEFINIDDCWMSKHRDRAGNMVADPDRFPRGIRFLADYMHARGLKLGIYQDFGHHTCMGYPGIIGHMKQDAKKFAEWDVDMLKLDGCYSKLSDLDWGFIAMGKHLKDFGKPILYSCSWPYYHLIHNMDPKYDLISTHCNMWRNFHDLHDSWESISETIKFFGDNQEVISSFVGPGHWSDPDMLLIGNRHLTLGQSRAQMAVWSMIPGPLLMSNDLRNIKPEAKAILLNKRVIAVNQDSLGIPGKRIYKKNKLEVWKRQILPSFNGKSSYALLFLNGNDSKKAEIKFSLAELDLRDEYSVTELFKNEDFGIYQGNDTLKLNVPPMDVVMLRCEIHDAYT